DDGDRHQLETVQKPRPDLPCEGRCAVGEEQKRNGRGKREGDPGREAAEVAGAHKAEREPDLAAGGPPQELAERDKVCVSLLAEPAAANDELLPEIADVSDRAAE